MKTLKAIVYLAVAAFVLSSCDLKLNNDVEPDSDVYNFAFCFRDAEGNDLAEGIELAKDDDGNITENVKSDLYQLGVFYTSPNNFPALAKPKLVYKEADRFGACLTSFFYQPREGNEVKELTYKLQCPHIFGNNDVHNITTHWELTDNNADHYYYAKCTRIVFEDKEVTLQNLDDNTYLAVITLD